MTTTDSKSPATNIDIPAKEAGAKPTKKTAAKKPKTTTSSAKPLDTAAKISEKSTKALPKAAIKAVPKTATKTASKATINASPTTASTTANATATPKKAITTAKPAVKKMGTKPTATKPTLVPSESAPIATSPKITPPVTRLPEANNEQPATQAVIKKPKTTKILAKIAAKTPKSTGFTAAIPPQIFVYAKLMRLHRPIGILLLLWPTLWSLWLAAKGVPSLKNLVIFTLGVVVMRSAGCVINDFADRKIDSRVKRTQDRPLATGAISSREAILLFGALCLVAFGLVLLTDPLTIKLSLGGLLLACCYPFMKRHTHLPQIVLGAAFAWGIPMAFTAEAGKLTESLWLIYLAVVLWTVVYDTFYAMVDRDDDIKIGVKSTAILFGEQDRFITGVLQVMTLYALFIMGDRFELGGYYYTSLVLVAGLFIYQQWLIRFRARTACFAAFLNNNWVGLAVFVGIATDLALH